MKTITTTTSDNIIFTGQLFESDNKENIIIHIHGMSGDIYINSFYPAMQTNYPNNGWSFLAAENRGTHSVTQFNTTSGEIVNIGNTYEIFEDSKYDIQAWVDKAKELGYKRIWLQGHSLGPSKLAYYLSQTPNHDIEGLILLSPSDMIGLVSDDKGHDIHLKQAQEFVSNNKGEKILDGVLWDCYKLSANTYLNFFGEGNNTDIFNYQRCSKWEVVNKINIPVITFTGTDDLGVSSAPNAHKAMERLESQLVNAPRKKTVVYKDGEHDFEGFAEDITKEVLDFVENK